MFGNLVVGLALTQSLVPPNAEPIAFQLLGKAPRSRAVFSIVREEDIGNFYSPRSTCVVIPFEEACVLAGHAHLKLPVRILATFRSKRC
jgi:hypothetical protein